MQDTTLQVQVLNRSLGVQEKLIRTTTLGGAALLRDAALVIRDRQIELLCRDDAGNLEVLASTRQDDIQRIRVRKAAISVAQQLIKPAVSGAVLGVVVGFLAAFQAMQGSEGGGSTRMLIGGGIAIGIFMAPVFALFAVLLNLPSTLRSRLSVVSFESTNGETFELAISDRKLDSLTACFVEQHIVLEPAAEQQLASVTDGENPVCPRCRTPITNWRPYGRCSQCKEPFSDAVDALFGYGPLALAVGKGTKGDNSADRGSM